MLMLMLMLIVLMPIAIVQRIKRRKVARVVYNAMMMPMLMLMLMMLIQVRRKVVHNAMQWTHLCNIHSGESMAMAMVTMLNMTILTMATMARVMMVSTNWHICNIHAGESRVVIERQHMHIHREILRATMTNVAKVMTIQAALTSAIVENMAMVMSISVTMTHIMNNVHWTIRCPRQYVQFPPREDISIKFQNLQTSKFHVCNKPLKCECTVHIFPSAKCQDSRHVAETKIQHASINHQMHLGQLCWLTTELLPTEGSLWTAQ